MADANRTVENETDGGEQAWDSKLPIMLAAGWSVWQKSPGEHAASQLDIMLGKARAGEKRIDFRLWLIPKTAEAALVLKVLDGKAQLQADGKFLDETQITFRAASAEDLPRSDTLRKFIERVKQKRFPNNDEFVVLVGRLNALQYGEKSIRIFSEPM